MHVLGSSSGSWCLAQLPRWGSVCTRYLAILGEPIADRHVAAAFQDGFLVESSGGKKFDDVNLEEKEWCDFDEKLDAPVGIYEVESRFERHKGK
jgi:hypothetical protein